MQPQLFSIFVISIGMLPVFIASKVTVMSLSVELVWTVFSVFGQISSACVKGFEQKRVATERSESLCLVFVIKVMERSFWLEIP